MRVLVAHVCAGTSTLAAPYSCDNKPAYYNANTETLGICPNYNNCQHSYGNTDCSCLGHCGYDANCCLPTTWPITVAATSRASMGAIGVTATHVFSYDKIPGSYGIGIYRTGAHPPATL